jgi:hypothetical protein
MNLEFSAERLLRRPERVDRIGLSSFEFLLRKSSGPQRVKHGNCVSPRGHRDKQILFLCSARYLAVILTF